MLTAYLCAVACGLIAITFIVCNLIFNPLQKEIQIGEEGDLIVDIAKLKRDKPVIPLILKTLASLVFVVVGVIGFFVGNATNVQFAFIITGLSFGVVGDVFLAFKDVFKKHHDKFIIAGILSFFAGHVFYILAFSTIIKISFIEPIITVVLAVGIFFLTKIFKLNFRKLTIPVALYTLVILFMMVLSFSSLIQIGAETNLIILSIAAFLFVVSDAILAFIYFAPKRNQIMGVINLSTYYIAQILIGLALMFF